MSRKRIDSILLAKAKKGDQKAFTSLFNFYYPNVFNYVKMMVPDYTEAEDLTMISFEKAFNALSKYVPMFEFKTWLIKIARNTAIDFMGRRNRTPISVDISTLDYLKSDIENTIERDEVHALLGTAMNRLDARYRAVIELYYYDECSYKDISTKLCIPINTVCVHIFRAKRILNRVLTNKLAS